MLADVHIRAWATCGQTRTRFKNFCKKKKKKKLFSCTVLTRENCKTAMEGENAKQSFASHVLSLILCAIDEVGKINRLPR